MTPEAARDEKKNGGQNANFEGHYLLVLWLACFFHIDMSV